jgi:hypothetical protein
MKKLRKEQKYKIHTGLLRISGAGVLAGFSN